MSSVRTTNIHDSLISLVKAKLTDYAQLVKLRLNLTVVFSATFGFLMAGASAFDLKALAWLSLGGFLVTSSANAINELLEKEYDKLMKRTANRPLAAGRMESTEAVLVAGITGVIGLAILAIVFNTATAFLGAVSLISYAFIYTPLKRYHQSAVFVGAIPGALPILIGWVAFTGLEGLTVQAYTLFAIQFIWQFPHFWAIGWLGYDEYKKAGFRLLTVDTDGRNLMTAFQISLYTAALVLISVLPFVFKMVGIWSLSVSLVLGAYFLYTGLKLMQELDDKHARKVMFASLLYLPLVQITMIVNAIA